jgi:type IV secretion system protein VirB8
MFGKQKNSPQIDNAAAKGINFEVSIADIAKRSEKRAWMIAWVAIFMVLIMLGGFIYILPLKKEVPYLIMADAFTGQATVATLRGDFSSPKSITQSEALNRSNVAQYIIGRESFDSAMMALRDWTLINSMSSSNVRAGYAAIHAADNLESPYKIYGKDRSIRVKILSIQLDQRGQGENARKSATVRYQRSIYNKKNGATEPLDSKIARLEFTYKANLEMDEKQRYVNPLGFQVTEYTVDNDFAPSPPAEVPVAAQQQPVAGYPAQQGAQPYPAGQPIPGQPVQGQPIPGQPVQAYPAAPDFGEGGVPTVQPQNPAPQNPAVPAGAYAPTGQQQAPAVQAPNQVNGVGNR